MRIKASLVAVAALACFVALGIEVTRYGESPGLLTWEDSLVNHSSLIAWWLTWSCYVQVLVPIVIVLLIVAWRVPAWRGRIIFSIVILLLCWRGVDFLQHVFARPRRLDWVVKHETAFSYPSSHAAIAIGFYGLWAWMLLMSQPPRAPRTVAAVLLAVLAFAICWARLALGAHYLTDLVGGALFAIFLVSAGLAIVPGIVFEPVAGRASVSAE
ncbi:MAG TPA: phosphatase PAP2 family protein [Candidatus Cybelea sp.]|nr:phosphatase PAP2 family protein [Candidatus Cybelea sp.]